MELNSVKLRLDQTTEATINLFGATVTSWICRGQEQLFVSKNAVFDNKKAIRGGIPVVFPNFGPWEKGPQHGFARISPWAVLEEPQVTRSGEATTAALVLEDTEYTRSMWNYKFQLVYRVELTSAALRCQLSITNRDEKPFDFTCLLHTYFLLPDISDLTIRGLQGLVYADKVRKGNYTENSEAVTVAEIVDRVYQHSPDRLVIKAGHVQWELEKTNMPDTVVWNPWVANAKAMADFGDDEYLRMVCVEPGYVSSPVTLEPDTTFVCSQRLIANHA